MSFTQVTITGQFQNPDGSAASGTFSATPSSQMTNGDVVLSKEGIAGTLDDEGNIIAQSGEPFTVAANDDEGTTPEGSYYSFVLALDGQAIVGFDAQVSQANGATVTFSQLQDNQL